MKNTVTTIANNEKLSVTVNTCRATVELRKEVEFIISSMTKEEREEHAKMFINDINKALKNNAIDKIIAEEEDYIRAVLMRNTFDEVLYNINKNEHGFNSPAMKDGVNIFVSYSDVARRIKELNKEADEKLFSFKGDFMGEQWAILVIFHKIITGKFNEKYAEKIAEIIAKNPDCAPILKGFVKYASGNDSATAQTEILNYFYAIFNGKTSKEVKAVSSYKDENNEKQFVFKDIEHEVMKFRSLTKTEKIANEYATLNALCNCYITSEQKRQSKVKGAKIADAIATLEPKAEENK